MKRGFICAMILALCLQCAALADAAFWTGNKDLYYHAFSACGGREGRVPISEEAALAFDKYLCPVCCEDADGGGAVDAAVRGGTIVVRFGDAWLEDQELTSVFGWSSDQSYAGNQALRMLGEYLHDENYSAFMEDYLANGNAGGRAYMPHVLAADGALVMCRRHINHSWYVIVRPQIQFGNSWDMYWRVNSLELNMQGGLLSTDFDLQTVEETRTLELESMNSGESVFTRSADGLEIAVYSALNGNIAVIREKDLQGRSLNNVRLRIGEEYAGSGLAGYEEEKAAVYCCMLSDGELAALQGNAKAQLQHVENVNQAVYRVAETEEYAYYSLETDGHLFSVARQPGQDPVDANFRLVLDGEPDCFAVQTDGQDYIMDYEGNEYRPDTADSNSPQRITPLVWYGETGVFLAEDYQGESFAVGEYLLDEGVEFGERYVLEKTKGDGGYHCWLMNEKGETILGANKNAFTIFENGEIHMENAGGEIEVYSPAAKD